MYREVHIGRLYEQIVEQIEARIMEGDLRPGDKLPAELELAEQFGVSRTAVREAIKALTQKGLVEVQVGKGTFIKNSTPDVVRDSLDMMVRIDQVRGTRNLTEVREILEPEIAALAAGRADEKHIKNLEAALATMEVALDQSDTFIEADNVFHLTLSQATHNAIIIVLINTLVQLLDEQRKRISMIDGGTYRAQEHHKQILSAIKQRDPEAARDAMRAHLAQVRIDSEASLKL
jgi:GntR family transcriptional repressor for pyruvate dehydrogenase complex